MLTWALNEENNLSLEHGQIKLVNDAEALRTRIDCALQVVKGEVDDKNLGVDYFGIIFSDTPINMKIQEIARVIKNVEGVKEVEFSKAEFDKEKQSFRFYFSIISIYGEFDYDKSFDIPE